MKSLIAVCNADWMTIDIVYMDSYCVEMTVVIEECHGGELAIMKVCVPSLLHNPFICVTIAIEITWYVHDGIYKLIHLWLRQTHEY